MSKRKKYLLDTNTFRYAVDADWNKPENFRHWVNRWIRINADSCYLPSVAVQEIIYGMRRKKLGDRRMKVINRWIQRIPKLDFDEKAAQIAGEIQSELEFKGKKLGEKDIQIAAIAIRYNLILVSHDQDFRYVSDLDIEDWTQLPVSVEMFFRKFIPKLIQPLITISALLIGLLVFFSTVPNTKLFDVGAWLFGYLLNMVQVSGLVGLGIGLIQIGAIQLCIVLQRNRIFLK